VKLQYFQGAYPNFGDDLNTWMWPRLLPGFFDDDMRTLFIGIGSTIGDHYDKAAKKVIFGAGYVPQYCRMPDVHGGDWDIYFVRGPRTAQLLNISPDLSLGDSAILLRTLVDSRKRTAEVISFIPHWESFEHGNWQQVCRLAGFNLIDPRRPVEEVITELLRSRLVVAEAMHGAIVADAMRIPWIPLLPITDMHRMKWFDWAEALGMTLEPHRLWPSSVTEAKIALVRHPTLVRLGDLIASSPIRGLSEKAAIYLAAQRLTQISKVPPILSEDKIMNRVTERMLEKVQQLRRVYAI
jgi:succinoglycan biosynthesis protein ExoV